MAGRSPRARPSDRADGPPDAALEVAVRVARLVGRGGRAVLVGVDGRSGSGKTSLASEVAAVLEGRGVAVALAEVEAFVPGWDGLAFDWHQQAHSVSISHHFSSVSDA